MKKSSFGFVLISSMLILSMIGFVSAQGEIVQQVNNFINGVIDIVQPLLQSLVGDISSYNGISSNSIFFAKLLIFILIFALVYDTVILAALFGDRKWVKWTISLVIPALAVRFISPAMVEAVAIPNTAFAVSLVAFLPFFLYFYFVEKGLQGLTHKLGRKVAWIFFAVIFGFVWVSSTANPYAYIYVLVLALSLIMLFMDSTIQKFFAGMEAQRIVARYKLGGGSSVIREMSRVKRLYDEAVSSGNEKAYISETPGGGRVLYGTEAYLADMEYLKNKLEKHL